MRTIVHPEARSLGRAAGAEAGDLIAAALRSQGQARIVVATGASQFATLETLVARSDIDWSNVECFHLDEYVAMDDQHPASFRRYLRERFQSQVKGLKAFHGVCGDAADPLAECERLGRLINRAPIDVLLLGIGENSHLAFNDPPADLTTKKAFLVVDLDEDCRRQQFGEGWFSTLDAVPRRAISMAVPQILAAKALVASVPDQRKAKAVKLCLEAPVSPQVPASVLRGHAHCSLHLDRASASLLSQATLAGVIQG